MMDPTDVLMMKMLRLVVTKEPRFTDEMTWLLRRSKTPDVVEECPPMEVAAEAKAVTPARPEASTKPETKVHVVNPL